MAATALVCVMPASASAADVPPPSDPQGLTPDNIDAYGTTNYPSTYGGVVEINGGQQLAVYLTNLDPSIESAFESQAPPGDLTFIQTPQSFASISVTHNQLTADSDQLIAGGMNLVEWWPDFQSGTEQIGVENLTAQETAQLQQSYGASNITVFNVTADQVPVLTTGREYDGPTLWNGGDYIADYVAPGSPWCSSSFGVKISGNNRQLSAAHCNNSTGFYNYNPLAGQGSGTFIGNVGERLTSSGKTDALAIKDNSADKVYAGGAHTQTLATIVGKTDNPDGASVYNDGAASGETGYLDIMHRDMCIHPTGFRTECGIVEATAPGAIADQSGDSGGPMLRWISGNAYAAGIVSAAAGQKVPCQVNIGSGGCWDTVFYSNIESVLTDLNAVLKTG